MRTYRGDRKAAVVANGGVPVTSGATSFPVAAGAITDFPVGPVTFEVQVTGESIIVTAGLGTTSWSGITRGANHTTPAAIPDGAILLEIDGANDKNNNLQRDETAIPTSMLSSSLPLIAGTAAIGTSAKAARADHVHPASGGGAGDATTSTVGSVEVDHAPSGAHPVALTTDGLALPSGMLSSATPAADAAGTGGTATTASRSDHAHPLVTTFTAEVTVPDLKITGLTGSVQASRHVGATTSGAPTTGAHLLGDASLSLSDGKWYICSVAGTPGTWVTPPASSGTVTSVALSLPADFTVSGSPVTGSGTLTAVKANQSANQIQAGPTTGSPAAPTYRALVAADVPVVNPSALTGSGTVPPAGLPLATTGAFGAVKPDGTTVTITSGVISSAATSPPTGSYSANAKPAIAPDSISLLDRFRGGLHSGSIAAIINEFDVQYYNGTYYLAYDDTTQSVLKHASSVAGAVTASTDVTIATHYPSLLFDGSTWHVWGVVFTGGAWHLQHYTSSTFGGTYTLADTTNNDVFDPQVRLSPIDGKFYCAYGKYAVDNVPPAKVGVLQATSAAGPWTDLGYIFSVIGDPPYAVNQFDPTPIFWNGRAYMAFSCTDANSSAHLALVELDPSTMKAISTATVIAEPLETGTANEMSNPIFLAVPTQPGQERIYVNAPPGLTSIQVGPSLPDGRRREDALRLNTAVGLDLATGIAATTHGGATWGDGGLLCNATPSGAYGWLNRASVSDFTLTIEFSLASLPGSDALLLRVSPSAMGTNEAALWVTSGGVLKAKVIGSSTLTLNGGTVLSLNAVYRASLRRIGSEVRLYLGSGQEANGTQADALTGLTEWSVANDKGRTQTAGEQALCTIFAAAVHGEALPLTADPFLGIPNASGLYTLPIATPSQLGGVRPDGTTLTVNATTGIASAISTGEVLMTDGVANPPIPLTTEDGTDWLFQH